MFCLRIEVDVGISLWLLFYLASSERFLSNNDDDVSSVLHEKLPKPRVTEKRGEVV